MFSTWRKKSSAAKSPKSQAVAGFGADGGHISIEIIFHIALKNLLNKKLRSMLTIVGVVIGVGAIFFLLSFGFGIQSLVTEQVIGNQSLKAIDVQTPNSKIVSIDKNFVSSAKNFAHVLNVGVQYSFPGVTSTKGGEVDSVVYGIDGTYQNLSNFSVVAGRLLDKNDTKAVVLSVKTLESLGLKDPHKAIGSKITVNVPLDKFNLKETALNNEYTLVGVVGAEGGNEVYLPSKLFDQIGVPAYSQSKVVVDDVANITVVRQQIESKGFQTASLIDTLDEINNIFRIFNIVLVGFGSIGMIVAILGMFNTLTISLLERTQEIGLMMSLGARRRDVRRLFILEATIISALGAIIGMILAFVFGQVVNTYLNVSARTRGVRDWFQVFEAPWWVILVVFFATIAVGLLVVHIPARRASRTNPIEALKRE